MLSKERQLMLFSVAVGLVSVSSLIYLFAQSPDYLKQSAEGTPFFTPPVINPDTGEAIELDELIRHYKTGGD